VPGKTSVSQFLTTYKCRIADTTQRRRRWRLQRLARPPLPNARPPLRCALQHKTGYATDAATLRGSTLLTTLLDKLAFGYVPPIATDLNSIDCKWRSYDSLATKPSLARRRLTCDPVSLSCLGCQRRRNLPDTAKPQDRSHQILRWTIFLLDKRPSGC
jgi:hypothetical protein